MAARLRSAIPVLRVADYARAKAFYTEKLGFKVGEEGGEPPGFGIYHRGAAEIFIDSWRGADERKHDGWRAYLHVTDAQAMLEELTAAGVTIAKGPVDTSYGLREVEIDDPDGNRLCFGQILDDESLWRGRPA